MKILALVPDAHGGFGGIALYNRDLIDACSALPPVEAITLLPRHLRSEPVGLPGNVDLRAEATAGVGAYFKAVVRASRERHDAILCTHLYLLPFARLAALWRRTPILCLLYGTEAWEPTGRFLVDRLAKRCAGLIAISDVTSARFRAWSGAPEARVRILPNAVHAHEYGMGPKPAYLAERYGVAGRRVIMTLGRLHPEERQKGFDELIDLLPRLVAAMSDLVYLIVGDGDDRPRLEAKARDAGVAEHVRFAGRIPDGEKADHYRLCDVYSMVGRQEGFGFVFLEALATGAPVVASLLDGSRNAVLEGRLGELAHPDDPDSLYEAILKAFSKPREIPELLEYFSFENFARRTDSILAQFLPGAGFGADS